MTHTRENRIEAESMSLKLRLTVMNFFQFYVWGAWLITIGRYWFENKGWPGTSFGAMFSTMGIASLFMPALMGIVADRWINAERLYGILHILGAVCLFAYRGGHICGASGHWGSSMLLKQRLHSQLG